jgi:hypothetical protein
MNTAQGRHRVSGFPSIARRATLAFASSLLAFFAGTANAASPPKQLYGKSILATWTEGRDMKDPDGSTRHRNVNSEYGIYISSQGNVFRQMGRSITNRLGRVVNSTGSSVGPGGDAIRTSNSRYQTTINFQGRAFHTDVKYESGARRITIEFNEGFTGCTLTIIHGKEGDTPIIQHGMNTRLHMLTSISYSGQTCSVKDGNAFGSE